MAFSPNAGRTARLRLLGLPAMVAAAAMVLAGCSATPSEPEGPVDLRVALWSANEAHHAVFNEIADEYIALHPDLVSSVTFEAYPLAEYQQALLTQVSGGDAPDLAWSLNSNSREYIEEGVFADVSEAFKASEDFDLGDVVDGSLDAWSKDGGIYAYPFSTQPFGLYANLDLLAAAGQPDPRDLIASGDWNWDKVMEMAGATADATGEGGVQLQEWSIWVELATMWDSFGASPWDKDGNATFNSPEMVQFFTWVNENMFENHAIIRPGETFDFTAGTAAFKIHLLSTSGGLGDQFKWDFLPLPSGPNGQVNVSNQAAIGVLAQSKHPKAAADFLTFFTDKANAQKLSAFFPQPRTSLLTVAALSAAAPKMSEEQISGTIIEPAKSAVSLPVHPKYSSFASEVASSLELISQPGADVKAILDDLQATVEPLMSR
ncbi:MAG TPA: sugar ABC transporter substrate-binding protein [Terrimesophilobacter sp.]|nr:sugar ABC transporter substrate-binding protein [Terrimesophilobacter sp.]